MKKKFDKLILREIVISVIIVSDNDSSLIERVLTDTNNVLAESFPNYEILVIDNNSSDNTSNKVNGLYAQIPNLKLVRLSKASSTDIAYTAGLDYCIGDYAILFNFHLVPPNNLPAFINKLFEKYDIVVAKSKDIFMPKWSLSYLFLSLIEKLSTHEFSYEPISLLALNRRAINSITKTRRKSRNFSYISNLIGFRKLSVALKPNNYSPKKIYRHPNFFKLIFIVSGIIISNSFKPIRLLSAMGMFISLAFLGYAFFVAIMALFFNTYLAPKGWVTMASVISIMFFLLFSLLTLIAEYLIRILNESRNEPLYFIADEIDKSIILPKKKTLNIV